MEPEIVIVYDSVTSPDQSHLSLLKTDASPAMFLIEVNSGLYFGISKIYTRIHAVEQRFGITECRKLCLAETVRASNRFVRERLTIV
jgi:hypothetical protein